MPQVVFEAYFRKFSSRKTATSAKAFTVGHINGISPKSKSDNGSWRIYKHSGLFGIIIAHYHNNTGLFTNSLNHTELEPSISSQKSGIPELCPGEA